MDSVEYVSALASLKHHSLWECANRAGVTVDGVKTPDWLRDRLLTEFEMCTESGQESLMSDAVSMYDSKITPEFKLAGVRGELEQLADVFGSAGGPPSERTSMRVSILIALCNSYTTECFNKKTP